MRQCKNWTIESIRVAAEARGGAFLSTQFTILKNKYLWRCGNPGHTPWKATAASVIYSGTWCAECHKAKRLEQLHNNLLAYVQKRGGEVVSDLRLLKNNRGRVTIRCERGHEWSVVCAQLTNMHTWCSDCYHGNRALHPRRSKYTIESLQEIAAGHGGQCLSPAYLGAQEKHLWSCSNPDHAPWRARAWTVVGGSWCTRCAAAQRNPPAKRAARLVEWAPKHGLAFLSSGEYTNWSPSYRWRCLTCKNVFKSRKTALEHHVKNNKSPCPICRKEARKCQSIA